MATETPLKHVQDPPQTSALLAGRHMLEDAARLCAWGAAHWRDDTDRIECGTQLHYAVDVDIVRLYSAPEESRDYGTVFRQAGDVSAHLVTLLSDFILRRWSGSSSETEQETGPPASRLILLPPHDSELKRVALAIHADATSAGVLQQLMVLREQPLRLRRN